MPVALIELTLLAYFISARRNLYYYLLILLLTKYVALNKIKFTNQNLIKIYAAALFVNNFNIY
jgi:hypothetical protein